LHHRLTDLCPLLGANLRLGAATRLTGLTMLGARLALLCAGLSLPTRALLLLRGRRLLLLLLLLSLALARSLSSGWRLGVLSLSVIKVFETASRAN
jgi:hypothetical protein